MSDTNRIISLVLDEATVGRRSPDVEHERRIAIYDLLEENSFALSGLDDGPYAIRLSIIDRRLHFEIRNESDVVLTTIALSLTPFRKIVKDYLSVCETYFSAIKTAASAQIEAIDMGRRSLHDEGSEILRTRLAEKVEIDFGTARRLFTLICVLHIRH